MPTYGSVNISKGYYNNGTNTIISSDTQASLSDLKTGQTVGCKNTLFMTSASGTIAPYITSDNAPTGTFDVYAALNTPIYLNWTKEYIAGEALIEPNWSFSNVSPTSVTTQKALLYDNTNDKTFWYPSATSAQLSNFIAKADKNNILYTNKTGQPTSDIVVSGNGTEYVKNFTEVGTPTISSDFAVSGFDSGTYYQAQGLEATVNFDPSLPWELNLRFKTDTLTYNAQNIVIVGWGMTSYKNINININKTSHVPSVVISLDGTTNTYLSDSTFVIQDNTEYWLRLEWNGSQYRAFYSTDGTTFTRHGLKTSSSPIYVDTPLYMSFGFNHYSERISTGKFEGTIYMKDCNLKSNGTVIWTGAEGYIADSKKTDSKYVWLNHDHDKILGIETEPDEIVLEVSSNNDSVVASDSHFWTYLGNTSYDVQGQSMAASSMTGVGIGSGYMMLNPNGTLAFTDAASAYQYVGGNAFSGYSIRFTDNTHTAISYLSNQSATKCRVYANLSGMSYGALYVTSLPPTGDITASVESTDGKLNIAPSAYFPSDSYTYDATNDTISIEGSVYTYIGDYYAII